MNKYQDFILENKIISLINESTLQASSNFLEKLKNMSKKNKIAKVLFDVFDLNPYLSLNLPQNWIDTDGEDTISFISDVKASSNRNDWERETPFSVKGRSNIKVGRFVKAFFSNSTIKKELHYFQNYDQIADCDLNFTDKDIEEFVYLYKATTIDNTKKFKLVKGENIENWYNFSKYASNRGTLGNSCMRDVDSSYFDIYVENERFCKLLIYINSEGKLLGRALVWKLHESPCDAVYFMDRVYVANDSDIIKFTNYAEEQGWLYKYKMSSGGEEGFLFRYKGGLVFGKIVVKLKESKFKEYPYCDTLTFLDTKDQTLSNNGTKNCYLLHSTDGEKCRCDECDGKGKIECDECYGDEDDCKHCKGEGRILCPACIGLEHFTIKSIEDGEYKEFKDIIKSHQLARLFTQI